MKKTLSLMGITVACTIWASACLSEAPISSASASSPYVYCNVYLVTVCFGISHGDVLKMKIPADFSMYTINLANGLQVIIYDGRHPEIEINAAKAKPCENSDAVYICQVTSSAGQLNILYQPTSKSNIIHIRASGITDKNTAELRNFLNGFRSCRAIGQSMECTNSPIFSNVKL